MVKYKRFACKLQPTFVGTPNAHFFAMLTALLDLASHSPRWVCPWLLNFSLLYILTPAQLQERFRLPPSPDGNPETDPLPFPSTAQNTILPGDLSRGSPCSWLLSSYLASLLYGGLSGDIGAAVRWLQLWPPLKPALHRQAPTVFDLDRDICIYVYGTAMDLTQYGFLPSGNFSCNLDGTFRSIQVRKA